MIDDTYRTNSHVIIESIKQIEYIINIREI